MIVSEARREANRRNALRSTGPKSAEGKARVRANAIKHGMTAETVLDPVAFRIRADEWHAVLKPSHETEQWMADEVARVTLQLDHSHEVERTLRDDVAIRAEVSWDADRRLEVETLALGISDKPGQVAAALQRTVHGCDFLIERWAMLAHVADQGGEWNETQVSMAFDLLGTPVELRGKNPCIRLDTDGRCLNPGEGPAAFARFEIESIRSIRDHLEPLDDFHQSATAADLTDTPTPELRRFRRYQTALQNRLKWCLKQLEAPKTAASPKPKPAPIAPPPPAPRPSKVEAELDDDFDDDFDDEPSDEEMMAWFKAEAAKAGFPDIDVVVPPLLPPRPEARQGRPPSRGQGAEARTPPGLIAKQSHFRGGSVTKQSHFRPGRRVDSRPMTRLMAVSPSLLFDNSLHIIFQFLECVEAP